VTAAELRPAYVEEILERAKQEVVEIPRQALVLAEFAWPSEGPRDPLLQFAARRELVRFGHRGMEALRFAIRRVDPEQQADVVAALVEARFVNPAGMPPEYLPALEEAIWFGSPEARRVALVELRRYKFLPALVSAVDAAHEDPQVARVAIRTLGRMGDNRARIFLGEVLTRGRPYYRPDAAAAIATLGGPAVTLLREAVRSPDADTSAAAVRELVPIATVDDLSALHEFVLRFGQERRELAREVSRRATELELQLATQRDAEAASGREADVPEE
jgi:hypothetical protein